MSDRAPKSAYELAMEKLQRRDQEAGRAPRAPLTDEQKEQIAEVRRVYEAKLAQAEILHQAELASAGPRPEKVVELTEGYQRERARLERQRDSDIAKIRGE